VSSALLTAASPSVALLQRFRGRQPGIAAASCAAVATNALVSLASAWLVGLLCAELVPSGPWQTPTALAAMSVAMLVAAWAWVSADQPRSATRTRDSGVQKLAALCIVGFVSGLSIGPRAPPPSAVVPSGIARFDAVVEDSQIGADQTTHSVLRVLHGARLEDGASVPAGCFLGAGPIALPNGARVRVLAKLAPRAAFRNPTPHPLPPRHFTVQGEAWIPDASAVQVLEAPSCGGWLDAARARVRERLIATLPARSAGVACALVLGDADAVDAADQAEIRDAGLLHVLAVSGLHVAVLSGLFVVLLQQALLFWTALAARVEVRRIACAVGVPAALCYAAFAGGAPSAWRAAVTAALAWTLVAAGRRPDAVATTAFAAMLLGAVDPREVTRPAFLLSIVATAAILAGPPALARDFRGLVRAAIATSVRAALATAPIVLWCFGSVPIVGVIANVVLLPFGSLLLVQLSAAHALLCTLTPLSAPSAVAFTLVSDAFLNACSAFARLAPRQVWPPPDVWQGLVFAIAAAALLRARALRAWLRIALIAALCLGLLEWRLRAVERPEGRLRVTFLDVGQGDAALIDLPNGRAMLIDAGGNPGGGPDPGSSVLVPLLRARRRSVIDIAVLTHPHPDHYGGLGAVLQQIGIAELWDNGQAETEAELQAPSLEASRLLAAARARGALVRAPAALCGHPRNDGGARIQVLAPCPRYDAGYDANDNSLVLRIDYGRRRLLFAGDAEAHGESVLLEHASELRADVLKVAHHGSRSSSSAAFLAAVAPKLAIISAGTGNRFGHPHAEALQRLKTVPHVLNLAEVGGTIVETDGNALQVRTWSGERFAL
jgi:competence protein ComEC